MRTVRRIESVDFFRVVAILAVIVTHTEPFENKATRVGEAFDLATQVNQLARFAVPFFFVTSGFFWGRKVSHANRIIESSMTMSKKLVIVFCAWSVIYLLPFHLEDILQNGPLSIVKLTYWKVLRMANDPIAVLFQGTKLVFDSIQWHLLTEP